MYPKNVEENIKYRANVILKAENDEEMQSLLIRQCKEDPLFFVNVFAWTYNPRLDQSTIPFITYEFQDDYIMDIIECIEVGQDNATEKSRDMGFSWQLVVIAVWGFLFKGWSGLYGSYKESYTDEKGNMDAFFERVRFVLEKLPKWMKPEDLQDKYMNISSKKLEADIAGDAGANFGTGGRRKWVMMDEFALWPHDGMAFRKTKDVTNCRIIGGTPEGKWNVYGKIMTEDKDYKHLDIRKFRLHWRLHPLKTEEWYEKEKTQRTPLDVAKELDISYEDSVTGSVYPTFQQVAKFGEYKFRKDLNLYTSWDFGRDMTCIIWWQKDFETDAIYIIDTYQKPDTDIDFFAAFINGRPTEGFSYTDEEMKMIEKHSHWQFRYAGHYGDPYNGDNRSGVTQNTFKSVLSKYGIHIELKTKTSLQDRIRKTTLAIRRMHIDDGQREFIQAITQSRYPQVKENSQSTSEKNKPIHDVNSHFRTALEYGMDNEPQFNPQKTSKVLQSRLQSVRHRQKSTQGINGRL